MPSIQKNIYGFFVTIVLVEFSRLFLAEVFSEGYAATCVQCSKKFINSLC